MRSAIFTFLISAALALAGLVIFSSYWNYRAPEQEKKEAEKFSGDVPVGYFDLRGNKEVLISLRQFDINPEKIVIDRGTKVIWKNEDRVFHRVVSDQPLFDSQNIKTGENFQTVFDKAGTFNYHCAMHADTMKGIIVVDE